MKGFLFLLACTQILAARVSGNHQNITILGQGQDNETDTEFTSSESHLYSTPDSLKSTKYPTTAARPFKAPATSPLPDHKPTSPNIMSLYKECFPVFLVAGGLIIICTILLVSTLLLSWKVCQLNRRIKALSSNDDLISNSEYWLETAKTNKSNAETEPRETTVLMSDLSPAQEDVGNGTTKEEGGTEKTEKAGGQEEKKGDENKEDGDADKSEGASAPPAAADEDSSSSKQQEKATDSDPTKADATAAPEGTEEPKDVV